MAKSKTSKVMLPRITEETLVMLQKQGQDAGPETALKMARDRVEQFKREQPAYLEYLTAAAESYARLSSVEESVVFALMASAVSVAFESLRLQMEKGE